MLVGDLLTGPCYDILPPNLTLSLEATRSVPLTLKIIVIDKLRSASGIFSLCYGHSLFYGDVRVTITETEITRVH